MAGYDGFRSIGPVMANIHATGLRSALWRGDLGAELPLVADGSPRPLAEVNDRRLSGGGFKETFWISCRRN